MSTETDVFHIDILDRAKPEVISAIIGREPDGVECRTMSYGAYVLSNIGDLREGLPIVYKILNSGRTDKQLDAFHPITLRHNSNLPSTHGMLWKITPEEDELIANYDIENPPDEDLDPDNKPPESEGLWADRRELQVIAGGKLLTASAYILRGQGYIPVDDYYRDHCGGEEPDFINDLDQQVAVAAATREEFLAAKTNN